MSRHLQALGTTLHHISREVLERALIPVGNWAHPHQPGDMVWVKDWKNELLQPSRTSSYLVILATPTAVKVAGFTSWIHHSRIKKVATPVDPNDWQAVRDSTNALRLKLHRTSQWSTMARETSSPVPSTSRSWLVNAWQKPEDSPTRTQMYPYIILLISVVAILFALGLAVTAPQDWNLGQRLLLVFCYLLIVGSLTAVRCCL
jgi:hypothetical protein